MLLRQTGFISPCPSRQRLAHACVQRAQPPATRRRAALETATTAEGEEEEEIFIDLPDAQHIILEPEFAASDAALVPELRSHYLQRFADPLLTSADRFCWDYWHVPGQYSLMRTPANAFFPEDLYDRLEDALIAYGAPLFCVMINALNQRCHAQAVTPNSSILSIWKRADQIIRVSPCPLVI